MTESRRISTDECALAIRRGAKAKITSGDAVLLVEEQHADGTQFWTLPGGGLEPGESPIDALRREAHEELDCRVLVGDRIDTVWYAHHSTRRTASVYEVYDCAIESMPTPNVAEGVHGYRWATPEAFPPRTLPQVRHLCE